MGIRGSVRDGALVAGALAVGVTGAAAADKLLTGKDIENGSIGKKELSKKAQAALQGQTGPAGETGGSGAPGAPGLPGNPAPGGSLLISTFDLAASESTFLTPGTSFEEGSPTIAFIKLPPVPAGGFVVRGLAVQAFAFKAPVPAVTATLFRDDNATPLGCTTPNVVPGPCEDTDAIQVNPGQRLSLQVSSSKSAVEIGTVTLSLQPAG